MNDRYFVWFHSYHYDSDDKWIEVKKEILDMMKPHEHELRMGNWSDTPFEDFICDLMELDDADLRPSEIREILTDNIVEIALC